MTVFKEAVCETLPKEQAGVLFFETLTMPRTPWKGLSSS